LWTVIQPEYCQNDRRKAAGESYWADPLSECLLPDPSVPKRHAKRRPYISYVASQFDSSFFGTLGEDL
jgi:hypothetical protein